ncbi:hypothetical protein PIB30_033881 [Stylosanthes scabra]|uniref:Uncharacterized protein n=1 Tax=Stylosanthes scabra TaxID=79078 RepID=A0ABU6TES7_9FABA|nr:hypothetical protein [Stylosanthes scabra]
MPTYDVKELTYNVGSLLSFTQFSFLPRYDVVMPSYNVGSLSNCGFQLQIPTFDATNWRMAWSFTEIQNTYVYTAAWIDEMKGKSRKAGVGWEPRAFLTRYTES